MHLQDEDSEESEENDQYLQLDEDEFQQVLQEVGDAWAVSFDGRCSKSRALTYTSFVLSPKMESLQHEWQKPGSVRTILELKGGDDHANIKANSLVRVLGGSQTDYRWDQEDHCQHPRETGGGESAVEVPR